VNGDKEEYRHKPCNNLPITFPGTYSRSSRIEGTQSVSPNCAHPPSLQGRYCPHNLVLRARLVLPQEKRKQFLPWTRPTAGSPKCQARAVGPFCSALLALCVQCHGPSQEHSQGLLALAAKVHTGTHSQRTQGGGWDDGRERRASQSLKSRQLCMCFSSISRSVSNRFEPCN
jgi:hypothetical protein